MSPLTIMLGCSESISVFVLSAIMLMKSLFLYTSVPCWVCITIQRSNVSNEKDYLVYACKGSLLALIRGKTVTAVCDLDKNTAGGLTKETHGSRRQPQKASRMSTCHYLGIYTTQCKEVTWLEVPILINFKKIVYSLTILQQNLAFYIQ